MKASTLPRPGIYSTAEQLRIKAAEAITAAEISLAKEGSPSQANELVAFFNACSAAAVAAAVRQG